ncbi:MAG TPA: hypothetical protein ENI87_09175 [bacterium]|nr:hypothetical protein [bacterium]
MHRLTTSSRAGSVRARIASLLFAAALATPAAVAQNPTVRPAPPNLLARFDVSAGTVQTLTLTRKPTGGYHTIVMLGGQRYTLDLQQHDVRAPGFQLLVRDAFGIHAEPTPPCVTYRGTTYEDGSLRIAATIRNGSLDAIVHAPVTNGQPGTDWVIQPVNSVVPAAGQSTHIVYRSRDSIASAHTCGNTQIATPTAPPITPDVVRVCDLAIEADLQFYQLNGSNVTQTQNDITSVMNQVDFIYDRDVDVTFNIVSILVTTTNIYTTNDAGSLLSQFGNNWIASHGNISRDLAHLFTGRNLNGGTIGIAYLGTVCSNTAGYGLSQSRFSSNFSRRVGLTAHEIGHNFNASHCNGINPCYIMCASINGCSNNVTLFGQNSINAITAYAQGSPCLAVQSTAPQISAITPVGVTVFQPGAVTLTGSGFTGVNSFRVGTQTYTSGYSVQSDTSMTVVLPTGSAIGIETLDVTNPSGTSNSKAFLYGVTTPPKLRAPSVVPAIGGTVTFEFAGKPNFPWFLILDVQSGTTPFQGLNLLSSQLALTMGTFPAPLGIESLTFPVPGGLGLLIVYTQILEADPNGATATGVSNIGVTVLL